MPPTPTMVTIWSPYPLGSRGIPWQVARMTSSIRKVLRKALLSLQLPAAKEGQECGDIMMSWDALNQPASRFAEPPKKHWLPIHKNDIIGLYGDYHFSHWNSNLGMNKWWLLATSWDVPDFFGRSSHVRPWARGIWETSGWTRRGSRERMNGWILENPGWWAQISHPPTRTANEKPWFSIGDLHIYIYVKPFGGCLILGVWWGMGFLSVLG